ncbi:MAG TPA: hypothetical protein VFU37_08105 [Pyrinomonadaceae bacterium]|nr:hypothetical protein [Pyrinomonadaceae bacterium]
MERRTRGGWKHLGVGHVPKVQDGLVQQRAAREEPPFNRHVRKDSEHVAKPDMANASGIEVFDIHIDGVESRRIVKRRGFQSKAIEVQYFP